MLDPTAISLPAIAGPEKVAGLYAAVGTYFGFLVCAAVCSYVRTRRRSAELYASGQNEDALTAHYLGHRSLGPKLMAATTFATVLSG